MRALLTLAALTLIPTALTPSAQAAPRAAAVPAPLNGLWTLTSFTDGGQRITPAGAQLVIAGNSVRGGIGCGRFEGTAQSGGPGRVNLSVTPLPPATNVRCLYALKGDVHNALNGVTGYVLSSDTQRLVLYSAKARLTFKREGYVTPLRN